MQSDTAATGHRIQTYGKHPAERYKYRGHNVDGITGGRCQASYANNWREMSGVLCDKRVPPHVKGNIHKMIVQPSMLYGMEAVPVTSSHVKKLEVPEIKMCRWARGHTLRDHVRNDDIRERLKVENITERCRKARLRWFGHVKRRDQDYFGRQTLEMVPPGRRKRGRPKKRWMDCVNRDMRVIGTTKDEVHDRTGWKRILSATPQPSWGG